MEKEKFYALIDSSNNFSISSLEQINGLVEIYPYFQGARILYLLNLKHINHKTLNSQINIHASLVPNRQHLFTKLNPIAITNSSDIKEKKDETIKTKKEKSNGKEISPESTFILLDGTNHSDALTINAEPSTNIADGDILELIDGDFSDQEKNPSESLIDAFLNNIPKIERPPMPSRGEVVENEDISLKSIEQPEELASEPLAQIYIAQGYFEKALAVYEKLCLKYPEKSSYFADQIQKVKEQINSKH